MASPKKKEIKQKVKKVKTAKPKVKASGEESKKETAVARKTAVSPGKSGVGAPVKGSLPRLQVLYRENVSPDLLKEFKYKSPMQIPKLEKIVLNIGMGEAIQNSRLLDSAVEEMTMISGQKPVVTKAKKSIAGFKLRAGMSIGCKVTLRGRRMYEFLDRFINAALPRIRDFRGVSPRSFDGAGNYSLGLKEQLIFPEINYDDVVKIHGMDISINTTARTNEEGRALLAKLGMPFRK